MEQLERTRRYLERMRQASAGVPYRDDASDYYADDVHSFFMNCYHVRDWLIESGTATQATVDAFVNDNFELRVCADLCNGTKHCRLRRKMRTSRQPSVAGHSLWGSGRVIDPEDGGVRPASLQCSFEVESEGQYYAALWLAERCMELWDTFISDSVSAS